MWPFLFKKPIVTVNQSKEITGLSYNATNALISDFIHANILKEMTGNSRNRVFIFDEYLNQF